MATNQIIKPKRGTTTPTTSNIVSGEVAIDTSAQKLYINDAGTVKEIGGIQDVVDDTTPQLGGNLDTNGNQINFGDDDKATFGDSSDLQIYHDGSNSRIVDNGTGELRLQGTNLRLWSAAGENYLTAVADGAVSLYHNNAARIATTSTGVNVPGNVSVSGSEVIDSSGNWTGSSSGLKGEPGAKGQKGEVGATGTNGTDGDKGQKGEVGANGTDGDKGATGQKGLAGTNGTNGTDGDKGQKGEAGTDGTDGDKGATGEKGAAGTNGTNGTDGSKGQKGDTGDKGSTGDKGVAGTNGTDGSKGQKGEAGTNGTDGTDGSKGQKGEAGTNGTNGTDGSKGQKGATGQKGLAGTNGTNGTNGADGSKGQKGEAGTNGTNGTNGSKGQKGEAGTNGTNGTNGSKGQKGEAGTNGTNGDKGATGQKGAAGTNGTNGTNGTDGDKGQKGEAGTNGTNGSKGQKGEAGTNGTDGSKGQKGEAGTNGTNGTDGDKGATGQKGAQGSKGQKGEAGTNGTDGSKGATGSTGSGITMQGSVATTGDLPGSASQGDAYIVQADDSLHIYDGSSFVSGGSIQGPQGDKGQKGQAGTNGTNGTNGTDGDKGATGQKGAAGTNGTNGTDGSKGQKGEAGTNGTNGTDGSKGQKGEAGTNGSNGSKGQKGEAGTNGTNGSKGQKGDGGTNGTDGDKGQKGEQAGITAIANFSDNRVLTASSSTAINGESGLTYNGSNLNITGSATASGRIHTSNGLYSADDGSIKFRQYEMSTSDAGGHFLLGKIEHSGGTDGAVEGIVHFAYDYGTTTNQCTLHFSFAQRAGAARGSWWYEHDDQDISADRVHVRLIDDGSGDMFVWVTCTDFSVVAVETWWRQGSQQASSGTLSSGTLTTGTTLFDTANDPTAEFHIGKLYAHDDVDISGALSATTKSFDIEHPTKEGMRLHHGSLEGPEHGVYIRGRNKGTVIELPEYWLGLVDESTITVQLTAIGEPQNLCVTDIKDNKVYVKGVEYFYFIQAERKDIEKFEVEYAV